VATGRDRNALGARPPRRRILAVSALRAGAGARTQAGRARRRSQPRRGAGESADAHPPFELPDDIKQYIAKISKDAEAKPQDAEAWALLGRVLYRASRVDPSFTDKAQQAYEHLHGIDARNLEGLRGLGNLAYDKTDRGKAIEHTRRISR
jgi:cytochrome c-type biogenesis protein CcmH/NrfG